MIIKNVVIYIYYFYQSFFRYYIDKIDDVLCYLLKKVFSIIFNNTQ